MVACYWDGGVVRLTEPFNRRILLNTWVTHDEHKCLQSAVLRNLLIKILIKLIDDRALLKRQPVSH